MGQPCSWAQNASQESSLEGGTHSLKEKHLEVLPFIPKLHSPVRKKKASQKQTADIWSIKSGFGDPPPSSRLNNHVWQDLGLSTP